MSQKVKLRFQSDSWSPGASSPSLLILAPKAVSKDAMASLSASSRKEHFRELVEQEVAFGPKFMEAVLRITVSEGLPIADLVDLVTPYDISGTDPSERPPFSPLAPTLRSTGFSDHAMGTWLLKLCVNERLGSMAVQGCGIQKGSE